MTVGTTEIQINGFHPLSIDLPEATELEGKVRLVFPPIHIQLYDLSMGIRQLQGAQIGADAPALGLDMEFTKSVSIGDLMMFIVEAQETLERMWKLGQKQFDEMGALL